MSKIAIATDSNSGITQAQGKELGIFVLPMPFYINDELFLEDITLSQEQFYERLAQDADVKTTQPSPGDVTDLWDKILQDYDQIVYIPMSSGLSSSCETAMMLAQDYEGKVFVVNNQRISVTQRQSVLDALEMAQAGKSAQEIHDYLERTKFDSDIYITVDTLKYLKKGGRCTPAAAALGAVLGIKPVLRIKGEKLDSFAKVRGWKAAKKTMIDAIHNTMETEFAGLSGPEQLHIAAAYTGDRADAQEWLEELEAIFPGYPDITQKGTQMRPFFLLFACFCPNPVGDGNNLKIMHIFFTVPPQLQGILRLVQRKPQNPLVKERSVYVL